MEVRYTLDKKSYRRLIEAMARTKGSRSHKTARAFCIFVVLVGGSPFWFAFGYTLLQIPITPVWLLAFFILLLLVLAAFIALGSFLGVKLAYIWMLAILGRSGIQQVVGKPRTLRLQDEGLYYEGPDVGPLVSRMTRPAASLRTVRTGSFGLVLVFRDGTSLGVPRSAFNQEQPLPQWKQALEQAMKAPVPAAWVTTADEADAPIGFSCKQGGDPTFIQKCSPERADAIYRESRRALMRGAYGRWNWIFGLFLLLCAVPVVWVALKSLFNALCVVILLGAGYLFGRHTMRRLSAGLAGKSVNVFASDAMVRTKPSNGGQVRLPYTEELWLVVTPNAISLYQPQHKALWIFDRQAFATPQEEEAFLELLKQRFPALRSHE